MLLYTLDFNDDFANQDACILIAKDKHALSAIGRYNFGDAFVDWTEADYWDCWVKVHSMPEIDINGYTQFYASDTRATILCRVLYPGQHPGGNAWWLYPVEPVMIPVVIR